MTDTTTSALGDPPNIRDFIARTITDHNGYQGFWDELLSGTGRARDLTSQERDRRIQVYRGVAEAVRKAMFSVPCGHCHPCVNWVDEEWRRAGRKPPYPDEWDSARERLAAVPRTVAVELEQLADLIDHEADGVHGGFVDGISVACDRLRRRAAELRGEG